MTDASAAVVDLARELIALDSRSFVSNLPVADRVEAALKDVDEPLCLWDEKDVAPHRFEAR